MMHSYAFTFCRSRLVSSVENLSCLPQGKTAHIIRHSECVAAFYSTVMQCRWLACSLIVCPVQYAWDSYNGAKRDFMHWNLAPMWQDSIKIHKYLPVTLFKVRRICHSFVPLFGLFMVHCAVRAAFVNKPWMNLVIVAAITVITEKEKEIRHLVVYFM